MIIGSETVSFKNLKLVQHTSSLSYFDDIHVGNEHTTLQNIDVEELRPTLFPEEVSLENKPVVNLNSTENVSVVSQQGSDNESNLKSLLIFEDMNDTIQQNATASLQKIEDEIIMDLEVFLGLQNVEELFDNLSEKDKEDDVMNTINSTSFEESSKSVREAQHSKSEEKGMLCSILVILESMVTCTFVK